MQTSVRYSADRWTRRKFNHNLLCRIRSMYEYDLVDLASYASSCCCYQVFEKIIGYMMAQDSNDDGVPT
jgi:hypothetical protein